MLTSVHQFPQVLLTVNVSRSHIFEAVLVVSASSPSIPSITVQSSHLGPVFDGHVDPLGPYHNILGQCSQWELSRSLCEQKLSSDYRE